MAPDFPEHFGGGGGARGVAVPLLAHRPVIRR